MVSDVVVLGTGGHARSCLDVIASLGWTVRGCVGAPPEGRLQAEYLGTDDVLLKLRSDGVPDAVIAVGDNQLRARLALEVRKLAFNLPPVISAHATVSSDASIGAGCVIMHGVVVGPYASIGTAVIVNTGASIDHDCQVGDFVHVAPGAHIAGTVTLGTGAFLGVGTSVIPEIRIGEWTTVGAGAAVVRDIDAGQTVVGVPARELPRSA
jgi:UDP-perosamine 4-acetyltransferase